MEQVSDDELDHGAEEDSDKEDQDLDKMFGAWLGELDKLTQVNTHTKKKRGRFDYTHIWTDTGRRADRQTERKGLYP